jgi:exodeoxyribonuclease VII small subunit
MAEQTTGEFEKAIDRLDQIVRELESGAVGLDKSVELFREGRDLARKCDELLKAAQAVVDGAANDAPAVPNATPGKLPF